ncbi:Aste57867_12237 [Aphanomyces stellatus]|uniref:Aste57867_12237 protein n=1 Tax=Aphanomyces stellatus TaxID=120398 RepID=A0A485KVH4_9STRA|nr:hypothetical protein As57867_012192 [Aphanomyces stellatus]VFT89091.1 Aste57867_12237 [Aphanomyces stellatus]
MEVAFVGGAMQVVCAIINNVLGKSKAAAATMDDPTELALRQELLETKQKVVALEMELAELHHKMQRDEREARQRRLKRTVEAMQIQIRKDKLDRRELSVWMTIVSALHQLNGLYVAGVVVFWTMVGLGLESNAALFAFHSGE